MTAPRLRAAVLAAAVGGVIGSLARYGLTQAFPAHDGFPWATFGINVVGSALLAVIGGLGVVQRTPWLGVFLGTGIMGGFTTMSAASEQTVVLVEAGHGLTALSYVAGTLVAALLAVWLVDRRISRADRLAAEQAEVDA